MSGGRVPVAVLLMLALSLLATDASADPFPEVRSFKFFGLDQGLPQSQVYALAQDRGGYLWLGTLAGLARYNGREFIEYTSVEGLASNQIESLAPHPDTGVWVGTTAGLCHVNSRISCIDALRGRAVRALVRHGDLMWAATDDGLAELNADDGSMRRWMFPDQSVRALYIDEDRALWVALPKALLRLRDMDGETRTERRLLEGGPVATALREHAGRLWIGTADGLMVLENGEPEPILLMDQRANELPDSTIAALVPDRDGSLLVATYRGLYRVQPGGRAGHRVHGLPGDVVRSLLRDREGVLWAGLDTGLAKLSPSGFRGFDRRSGMLDEFVRTIARDSEGRLWLGTRSGVQIVPLRDGWPRFDLARSITPEDGLPNERIYDFDLTVPGETWLATNRGLVLWREPDGVAGLWTTDDGLPSNRVRSLARDPDGTLWVATNQGVAILRDGEIEYQARAPLDRMYAISLRFDDAGRAWFGTVEHGLVILEPDGDIVEGDLADIIGDRAVWDLWPDPGGRGMWVGSNGDGLIHVDSDGQVLRQITRENGLGNNFVWSVLADSEGEIWAYTTRGLSRYDGRRILNYDEDDGLLHSEGISTAALESPEGVLWFGAVTGLMRFDRRAGVPPAGAPPVFIEQARVDGRELRAGEQLPQDRAEVRFSYAATSFTSENSLRYRHRLRGLSDEWSVAAPYRPINYAGLDPGEYEFQVMATNGAGEWSEQPARFAFSVAAPVWRRPWFALLAVMASVLLVVLAVRLYERRLRRRAADLEQLVETRTQELRQANLELRRVATTDPLTGLKNRRYLSEQIPHDVARLRRTRADEPSRHGPGLVFLLIDLDSFKQVNDQHGHPAGDRLLAQVAQVLEGVTRGADYVVRWGGDEFLCVLRDCDRAGGRQFAERLLAALRRHSFEFEGHGRLEGCGGSIGICHYPFGRDDLLSWDQVIEVADAAVYLAKRDGGRRWVEISPAPYGDNDTVPEPREFIRRVRVAAERMAEDGYIEIRRGERTNQQR